MFHTLRVADIRPETNDTVSISFEVSADLAKEFSYVSGQYINLNLSIGGEEVRRAYSLCSTPQLDGEHRIAVKQIEDGKASTFLNQQLTIGDEVEVSAPEGHFVIPTASEAKSHVFIAGGSGITPVYSMIRSVLHTDSAAVCTLFYVNRSEDQVIFKTALEELKQTYGDRFQYHQVFTQPASSTHHELLTGRPDPKKILAWFKQWVDLGFDHEFYLCGPQGLMDAAIQAFSTARIDEGRIHKEYFATPETEEETSEGVQEEQDCKATLLLDDEEHAIEIPKGTTVLDAALQADLDAPYSCRGAVCSSCVAKIEKGTVRMRMNYTLTDGEVEEGYILTCQSVPTSPTIEVDFDA